MAKTKLNPNAPSGASTIAPIHCSLSVAQRLESVARAAQRFGSSVSRCGVVYITKQANHTPYVVLTFLYVDISNNGE